MNKSFITSMTRLPPKPEWVKQEIDDDDEQFLADLIMDVIPREMVEIGVGSGWSSLIILRTMYYESDAFRLHSFDINTVCSWDESHLIGSVVKEVSPQLLEQWTLRKGNSSDAVKLLYGRNIQMAFIDADHAHPWPSCDLLTLLPVLAPNACVVLHDVNMPGIGGEQHGSKILFEAWPAVRKRLLAHGGQNIGAVQLPENVFDCVPWIKAALSQPWESRFLQTMPEFEHLLYD
jgi:predicted O-methyltransferase YrrM